MQSTSYTNIDRDKRYKDSMRQNTLVAFILTLIVSWRVAAGIYAFSPDHRTLEQGILDLIWDDFFTHPFRIWPISFPWVLLAMLVPFFVWLSEYQNYIKKRNTMWKDAHGSAGFEKDFPGYYREFLYDPDILGGKTYRNHEGKKISKKWDFVTEETVKNKVIYFIVDKTPWRSNLITPAMVKDCKMNAQIFSAKVYLSLSARFTQRNSHVLVIGASGTGKSRFIIKPNILQVATMCSQISGRMFGTSLVVTDPSSENVSATGRFLESQGYVVKIFNLKDMTCSCRYNPFHYIRGAGDIPSLVNCLKNNIDSAGTGKKKDSGGNKFWDDSTVALLCACVGYLYEAFTDENEYLVDENGELIPELDDNGNPVYIRDIDGNPLLEKDGSPMIQYKTNPYWVGKRNFKSVMQIIRMSYVDESQPDMVDDMDRLFADWEASHPKSFAVNQYKTFKLASGKTTREILVSTAVLLGNYFD